MNKKVQKGFVCVCGGSLVKRGLTKAGTQRYKCPECGRTVSYSSRKKLNFKENVLNYGIDYIKGYLELNTQKEMAGIKKTKDSTFYFDDSGLDKNGFEIEKTGIKFEKRIKYFFGKDEQKNILTSIMFPHTVLSWLLSRVDDDNTNEINGYFLGLEVKVTRVKDYYLFSHNGESLMMIYKLSKKNIALYNLDPESQYLHIDFYGTFFALDRQEIVDFKSFYKTFIQEFPDFKVTRLDFMMDFANREVVDIMGNFKCLGSPESLQGGKGGSVETAYFGRYSQERNKRALVRIYDKLLQAKVKHLEHLYIPYFQYENVARFEVEFRSLLLSDFDFEKEWVLDDKKLLGMLKTFMDSRNKKLNFDFLEVEKIPRSRKESKKAIASYWASRAKSNFKGANQCGVSDLTLLSLIKEKSEKETLEMLKNQYNQNNTC